MYADFLILCSIGGFIHMAKSLQKLNLNSAFLFAAALADPETCRLVLEILLGRKIPKVNVKSENTLLFNPEAKCVRLDIHATDDMEVHYNLEAQNVDEHNLPKRCRYYQSEMDMTSLQPGQDYNDLKEAYVIFICTFDPFGQGLCQYTFERMCKENGESLGDESKIIIFNTKGNDKTYISEEIKHFLEYFENSTDEYVSSIEDEAIIELHERVTKLKESRELEAGYMKLEELINSREKMTKISSAKKYIIEALKLKEFISEELINIIESEHDLDRLNKWFTLSITAESQEEFISKM